jgi:hypothetical protein
MDFGWWHYTLPVALLIVVMILTIAGILIKPDKPRRVVA